jgi:flagellin
MGSFSILNNISGFNAQNQLNLNNVNLSRVMERLSSGKRINSGADDAAGLQIADSLHANTMALDQAVRNANDGISVSQIADGALQQITNLLTRGVTLAEEAATGTVDAAGRDSLQNEFKQIRAEIARVAEKTNFNGKQIFTDSGIGGSLVVFVGDISQVSSISVTINTITASQGAGDAATLELTDGTTTADLMDVDLSDDTLAEDNLGALKDALNAVAGMRANIGSGINRLQSAVSVLQTTSQNTAAAESSIRDANIAQEVSNLTKYQILAQTGMAALAQANTRSQSVLSLLR